MEPPLADQYDSIEEFIASRLWMMQRAEEHYQQDATEKRQVNSRIPVYAYNALEKLAGDVGLSTGALAAALLELAIFQAEGVSLTPSEDEQ